jgi:hypothetical protein
MFALSAALTALLLETLPSAAAGLSRSRAGLTRLDQLTRLGLLQGRNLRAVSLLGAAHLAGKMNCIRGGRRWSERLPALRTQERADSDAYQAGYRRSGGAVYVLKP